MTDHRFLIAERVVASGFGVPPGPYEITRMLPVADGIPFYRAKSVTDGHERVLSERSLRPAPRAVKHQPAAAQGTAQRLGGMTTRAI
jgi:hypothetical protein